MKTGIINVDKPSGMTSGDVVYKIRKIFGTKAVGHMGTLDPQGTGVLLVGMGKATRLFDYLLKKDKVYKAVFEFGYETDTLDGEGKITGTTDNIPFVEDFICATEKFLGKTLQTPPQFSAKNVNGTRAYVLARTGKEVVLPAKEIEIFDISGIKEHEKGRFELIINCSSGTYIRSLCRDIAKSLGSLATMTAIRRLRSGKFCVENSYTLEQIAELKDEAVTDTENCLDIPTVEADPKYYSALSNGVKIDCVDMPNGYFFIKCKGELFGIYEMADGKCKLRTYLKD